MILRRWRLALASFLFLTIAMPRAWASADISQPIRVGLVRGFRGIRRVTVMASGGYSVVRTGSGDKIAACANLEPITIQATADHLSLKLVNANTLDAGTCVTIAPNDAAGMLSVDSPGKSGKRYRGTLEVSLKSGTLQLVNTVSIEDYLPGVVTGEMPSSYPDEALKAQAVAARTYTLCALHRHSTSGYDLCDDAHCQVYDGALREQPSSTRAVLATKGQVVTYGGRLASIMYCADCGGVTECYSEAHSGVVPYMPSVLEPEGIKHCSWEKTYKLQDLAAKLVASGIKEADGLQKIAITKTSSSGRGLAFEVAGTKGKATITGIRLRQILGRDGIRSTLCAIDASVDGAITFRGKGWGHGIGLCQVGAGALACPPFSYTYIQILAHYYPGTTISTLSAANQIQPAQDAPAQPAKKDAVPRAAAPVNGVQDFEVRVVAPRL